MDTPYFKEILSDEMSRMGYEGLFAPKCLPGRPEGVAMFFKRVKFELEETKPVYVNEMAARTFKQGDFPKCEEVVLLAALRHKISNNLLVIGEDTFTVYTKGALSSYYGITVTLFWHRCHAIVALLSRYFDITVKLLTTTETSGRLNTRVQRFDIWDRLGN